MLLHHQERQAGRARMSETPNHGLFGHGHLVKYIQRILVPELYIVFDLRRKVLGLSRGTKIP